jgi:cadmium resistance protein CadD (predicted permease)
MSSIINLIETGADNIINNINYRKTINHFNLLITLYLFFTLILILILKIPMLILKIDYSIFCSKLN